MFEQELFKSFNENWDKQGPEGSDNIRVYLEASRYNDSSIATLNQAYIFTPETFRYVEHLRAVIYNPENDKTFVIYEEKYEENKQTFIDSYDGKDGTEIALRLMDRNIILPPV